MKINKIHVLQYVFAAIIVSFFATTVFAQIDDISKCNQEENKADCEARLDKIIKEQIPQVENNIKQEENNQQLLSGEINKLDTNIKQTAAEIAKKNNLIENLGDDIEETEETIDTLNARLAREKQSLQKIIRRRREISNTTLFEVILSNRRISDFYEDIPSFAYVQSSLSDSFEHVNELKIELGGEKERLKQQQEKEDSLKYQLQTDKKKIEGEKKTKAVALDVSKDKEATLADLKRELEKEAAEIRSKLFELRDIEGGGIPFGDAYDYAKQASASTGVRPAFILAILEQESNLGNNVGTCNRNNNEPIWSEIMPGPTSGSWRDDQTIFKGLMAKLGRPLVGTPLSCPIKINGSYSGWGGAMGPSQFIPATWKSYETKIANAVGATTANPWNARHAIFATALYVRDLGANKQTYAAEKDAACRYYSGRGCADPGVRNAFYGNGVMDRAVRIQSTIDLLNR